MNLWRRVWPLAALVLGGCGAEGLTIVAQSPMAVGAFDDLVVERCLEHSLLGTFSQQLHPCTRFDVLTDVTLSTDGSAAFALEARGSHFHFEALAPGTTRLTARATTASGEKLTETFDVEARAPAHHRLRCLYTPTGDCMAALNWLPGRVEELQAEPITDSAGARLFGLVEYRATGSLHYEGLSTPLRVSAGAPGEGRLEPVSEVLREVTPAVVMEVASPDDAVSLHLASALYGDAGEALLPVAEQPAEVTLKVLADGGVAGRLEARYPVLGLRDGGWARPDLATAHLTRADGGVGDVSCDDQRCSLSLFERGTYSFSVAVPPGTLSAPLTVR